MLGEELRSQCGPVIKSFPGCQDQLYFNMTSSNDRWRRERREVRTPFSSIVSCYLLLATRSCTVTLLLCSSFVGKGNLWLDSAYIARELDYGIGGTWKTLFSSTKKSQNDRKVCSTSLTKEGRKEEGKGRSRPGTTRCSQHHHLYYSL